MKKAWQLERELRDSAIPLDRRIYQSNWAVEAYQNAPAGDDLLRLFWSSNVPGSGAPEIPYQSMVQALGNKGFNVTSAEILIPQGIELFEQQKIDDLRVLTVRLLAALNEAPIDTENPIHTYQNPGDWESIIQAMGKIEKGKIIAKVPDLGEKIYQGWIGQLAGGSFGTAIEGYTSTQIANVYGEIRSYITSPETTNDDVVYELIFLDVFERMGRSLSSIDIGLEWVRQIQFGWSAEWVALRNLNNGILPPQSGSFQNPYSHWIGAQMRGMICGMLAPAWPIEAARLAFLDAVVSHDSNGVYGEIYAAVLTSLAFAKNDIKELLWEALEYVPQKSQYHAVVKESLEICASHDDKVLTREKLEKRFEQYNWIHAYPNIAAVVFALWFGNGDMTETFSLLAKAGYDVDCNGGLVGNVLGVISGVPTQWSKPIGDLLETYIKGKEKLSIQELADRTARLSL
ncbi:MAG: ADP-ribosylglycohydrolase family protein [Chloroflexi bacterium HGW-Chloroflexi-8]|nr:MAG: ADP-ribosylglycohydrolase family protein [Chloroflexi bacterium HGW-Chloroflexi-8]